MLEFITTVCVLVIVFFIFLRVLRKNIPENLQNTFKNLYPEARNVDWTKVNNGYEVVFFSDNKEKKARFAINGNWIETKTKLAIQIIPATITKKMAAEFPGNKIIDVSEVQEPGTKTYYKVIFTNNSLKKFVLKINLLSEIIEVREINENVKF